MIRVLVMAESSLLADAIASNLAQEVNLKVLRLTQHDPSRVSEAIHEACPVLILIEEKKSNHTFITANDLLRDYGCFRLITISAQKHHLHICDSYELPISGMAQVTNLAKGFNRENGSEVAG